MEKQKCPEVRFKGFIDEWKKIYLKDFGYTFTGLSGKTKDDFGHGDGQFITYMNVFTNTVSDPKGVEKVEIDFNQNDVKYGDILFTTSSETPHEVGMSSVWLNEKPNTYLNSFCFGVRPFNNQTPYFLAYLLRSNSIRKQLIFLAQGISRYNISKTKAMEINLSQPCLEERIQIGNFFQNLDQSIALHEKKLSQTQNLKKAMLEKMFPKAGSMQPEIRLKGFSGDWVLSKIGEVFHVTSGGTPLRSDLRFFENADIDWVKTTDLNNGIINKTEEKISSIALAETSIKILPKGTVFVAMYGGFNQIGRTGLLVSDATCNQALSAIYPNDKVEPYYLLTYLNFKVDSWKDLAASSRKDPNITKSDVLSFPLMYPSVKEQFEISHFFKKLDETLTLQQQQLQTLKNLKQAFLEKMFV